MVSTQLIPLELKFHNIEGPKEELSFGEGREGNCEYAYPHARPFANTFGWSLTSVVDR